MREYLHELNVMQYEVLQTFSGDTDAPPWEDMWAAVCSRVAVPASLAGPGCRVLGGLASTALVPSGHSASDLPKGAGEALLNADLTVVQDTRRNVTAREAHVAAVDRAVAPSQQDAFTSISGYNAENRRIRSDHIAVHEPESLESVSTILSRPFTGVLAGESGSPTRDIDPEHIFSKNWTVTAGIQGVFPPLWRRPGSLFQGGQLCRAAPFWKQVLFPAVPKLLQKEPRMLAWVEDGVDLGIRVKAPNLPGEIYF
jgi:hypothetical protein